MASIHRRRWWLNRHALRRETMTIGRVLGGRRPRKMHSTRGGVHAVDMIDATFRKPPPITAVQSDRAADLCRQHGVAVVNDAAGGPLFCEARANRSHLARLQFLHAGPGLEISEQCRGWPRREPSGRPRLDPLDPARQCCARPRWTPKPRTISVRTRPSSRTAAARVT
jgi:hypothetical protein